MISQANPEMARDALRLHESPPPRPSLAWRALPGILKRLRLAWHRLICRRAQFGSRTDIRSRFCLRMGPNARVAVGPGCVLDNDMTIECEGSLEIGARTIFGHHCTVASRRAVIIGEDCMIAEMVSIRDHNHRFDKIGIPYREQGMMLAPVRIGRNVWIGAKVTVLMGVTIGDNSVIGANAVVTKDVPADSIAVGIPARVIRKLGE